MVANTHTCLTHTLHTKRHSLASYCSLVKTGTEELAAELATAAKTNKSVDINAAMCNLTLKAIGEAAFGCARCFLCSVVCVVPVRCASRAASWGAAT